MLAQIVQLAAAAARSKAPIQKLAERVARYFVPTVVLIALASFVVWLVVPQEGFAIAFLSAISVLIVACALGLATPLAVMVGTGKGAQHGVLIRDGEVLENLGGVGQLLIDKTGTLTHGSATVCAAALSGEGLLPDEQQLMALAASLETFSEHPLGAAIVAEARKRECALYEVKDFAAIPGQGVRAVLAGVRLATGPQDITAVLGNRRLLQQHGIENPPAITGLGDILDSTTVVYVALQEATAEGRSVAPFRLAGTIAIADQIKASALRSLGQLKQLGLYVAMLTGDSQTVAQAVGEVVGITDIWAELSPQDKAEKVQEYRNRATAGAAKIAMAGDGINDAVALSSADVGIAMDTGTDVAVASAGVTLVAGDLYGIVQALRLSRATLRHIKQNLFFAFAYNALGIPLAAGVFYPLLGIGLPPVFAAAAMALSSVSVIGNSLRLRRLEL